MKETKEIKSMFDKIVRRYDFLNHLLSFGQDILWRKKMANKAVNESTHLVLDLAAGTADSALALIKKGVKVIGVDISFEMLKFGKDKMQSIFLRRSSKYQINQNKIYLAVAGSGYQIPFKDNIFDAVTCAFGIRNMHDTENALKEIYRVLKKNGRIVILEFSLPKGFFKFPYLFYLKKIVPFVSSIFSNRSAYEYLGSSIEGFYKPEDFTTLLKKCGFKNVTVNSLSFGCVHLYLGEK
jgi:demethylmenaquinone methyltransferase/2-methoxy-6-polyprenyl-1,4-benzoquinol methylase